MIFNALLEDRELDLMVNVLLILAKFFIHKAKFMKNYNEI